MLAWASPQSLCLSSRHANRTRTFRAGGSPCWRGPARKAFVLRHATPTPAPFPRRRQPMLAWASPQSLCPSSRHANRARIFCAGGSPCWRGPARKAFVLRLATPTGPGLSALAAAHVGVGLPAKPLSFVTPRQHRRLFHGARQPMLAWDSLQSLCPSSRHANRPPTFRAGACFYRLSCTKNYDVFN